MMTRFSRVAAAPRRRRDRYEITFATSNNNQEKQWPKMVKIDAMAKVKLRQTFDLKESTRGLQSRVRRFDSDSHHGVSKIASMSGGANPRGRSQAYQIAQCVRRATTRPRAAVLPIANWL
jgi:hypothetical protein